MSATNDASDYVPDESRSQIADAWHTKVHERLHLPLPLPWTLIGVLFFLGGYYTLPNRPPLQDVAFYFARPESQRGPNEKPLQEWIDGRQDPRRVLILGYMALLIAAGGSGVVFCERVLDRAADAFPDCVTMDPANAREWGTRWHLRIFRSRAHLIVGTLVGLAYVGFGYGMVGDFYEGGFSMVYAHFLCFVVGLVSGPILWVMYQSSRMISSLGSEEQLHTSVLDAGASALRLVSLAVFKISVIAVVLYLIGLLYFLLNPQFKGNLLPAIAATVLGLAVLWYFAGSQLNIHAALVQRKREKLRGLVDRLEESYQVAAKQPSDQNFKSLQNLLQLQKTVNSKSSWAFGMEQLLFILGSVIVPVVCALIKLLE
jgi:hypothetical protein